MIKLKNREHKLNNYNTAWFFDVRAHTKEIRDALVIYKSPIFINNDKHIKYEFDNPLGTKHPH